MPKATITSKGQLTLPKEVRTLLGVDAGDRVDFKIGEDGAITIEAIKGSASRLFGRLSGGGGASTSISEMHQAVVDAVAADDDRIRSGRQ